MGRLSEELIDEIRNKNDLLDFVSCYVTLKKSGKSYQGVCPFHSERTPSFSVSPDKGLWYCFGCGVGGNIFDFVRKIENISFPEAAKFLAERAGIEIKEEETDLSEHYRNKKDLYSLNEFVASFYNWVLFKEQGAEGLNYLKKRGLSKDIILKFKIGYAPARNSIVKLLAKKGYSTETALKGGLIRADSDGYYSDYFFKRIIFPIFDLTDRVIGFGGRIIGEGQPKYLNTPETQIFSKGKNLYGLNFARQNNKSQPVIITEGYMDLLSIKQIGIEGVAASLGTSFTMEQAHLLKKFTDEVILSYDGDTAGIAATGRGVGLLENAGLSVHVLLFPEGKDPDDYIREAGAEAFKEILNNKIEYFPYLIKWLEKKNSLSTREGKEEFLKGIEPFMTNLDDPLRRNDYFELIENKKLGISQEDLRSRYRVYKEKKKLKVPVEEGKSLFDFERLLLRLSLQDINIMKKVFSAFTPDDFSDAICREIAEKSYSMIGEKKDFSVDELIKNIENEQTRKVIAEMLLIDDNYPTDDNSILGLVKTLRDKKLINRKREIEQMIELGKVKPTDEIYKEYQKLVRYFSGYSRKGRAISG